MSRKTAIPKTFEEAIARLEAITQSMQNNALPLEEALAAYEEGTKLVRFCQEKLAQVEQKLAVLEHGELKPMETDDE